MEENWKPWPRNPQYLISDLGRVKGLKGQLMSTPPNNNGYAYTHLMVNNKRITIAVHRLVMETFEPIEGMEKLTVDHLNGQRMDNRLVNLRWADNKENNNAKIINRQQITKEITRIIQLKGYEETLKILQSIQ